MPIVADQTTISARLTNLGSDWLAEKMAPKFALRAGQELAPEGVNLAVELALFDVTEGLPEPAQISIYMLKDEIAKAIVQ